MITECPKCGEKTTVIDSRNAHTGRYVRRRRECTRCGYRFTTYEMSEEEFLKKTLYKATEAKLHKFLDDAKDILSVLEEM